MMDRYHEKCQHKLYRLTCAQMDGLLATTRERCQICDIKGSETAHGVLHIDHDSSLGYWAVRGLLCSPCNSRLENDKPWNPASERYLVHPVRSAADAERFIRPQPDDETVRVISEAATRYWDLTSTYAEARATLITEIQRATTAGMPQVDIVKATGWTREQIRRVCRG